MATIVYYWTSKMLNSPRGSGVHNIELRNISLRITSTNVFALGRFCVTYYLLSCNGHVQRTYENPLIRSLRGHTFDEMFKATSMELRRTHRDSAYLCVRSHPRQSWTTQDLSEVHNVLRIRHTLHEGVA